MATVHPMRRPMTLLQRLKRNFQLARHQRRTDLLSKEHVVNARERLTHRRGDEDRSSR